MAAKPQLLFIINPTSGRRKKIDLPAQLKAHINTEKIGYEIAFTEGPGHATVLAKNASENGFAGVVAVGGDGTVNEVARGLIHSKTPLGVIPRGSGNGLARHMQIPLEIPKAIQCLNQLHTTCIDSGEINGFPFFTTAGIGFDAHISDMFAGSSRRGLRTYVEMILKEFMNYEAQLLTLKFDDTEVKASSFVLAFANAAQYGNNAFIAPMADIKDGMLDVVLIKQLDFRKALELGYSLLTKLMTNSPHAQFFKVTKAEVQSSFELPFHADGDYRGRSNNFEVKILPLSLNVIVPK